MYGRMYQGNVGLCKKSYNTDIAIELGIVHQYGELPTLTRNQNTGSQKKEEHEDKRDCQKQSWNTKVYQ